MTPAEPLGSPGSDPVELHRQVERALGLPAGSLTWIGPIDRATDPLWRRMLAKEITERDYWHQRAREIGDAAGRGPEWTLRDYMQVAYDLPEDQLIRPGARRILADCRAAGRKVGVLTNDLTAFHGPDWVASISFLREVDGITDLSASGHLKPAPEAYARGLADLGVTADAVVFVDDQPRNVDGARALGIDTVLFDVADPERSWDEARARLGL